jgi:hypothetical protein
VIAGLHKNAALLAVVVLVVHIATAVADSYAPLHIVDVVMPFVSRYRPFWLGLGALALDLLVALVATSLLRGRLGYGPWRIVHWAAYACWPVAVLHGLGTGSDTKMGWVLGLNLVCAGAVLAALWWRLAQGWSIANMARRSAAVLASIVLPLAVVAWTVTGPLRPGWARRAGTPTALINASSAAASRTRSAVGGPSATAPSSSRPLSAPFSAAFLGDQRQTGPDSQGLVSVIIDGAFAGGRLSLVLTGQPAAGGGVELTGSQLNIGSTAEPNQYQGHVTQLDGAVLVAALTDTGGASYTATIHLRLTSGSALSGSIEVTR